MSLLRRGVGIIGCGNIAGPYVADLKTYPEIDVIGVTDLDADRAKAFGQAHGVSAFPTIEALLSDGRVDIVVNLTSHFAHYEVTSKALHSGKHVYSEKPLALRTEEAQALVELAAEKGRRLACSPFTLAGEAQQTAWKLIRDGRTGKVRVVYAEVNWGRIESWHPSPRHFYEVGPLFDVGVYPLMILTAMFGPAQQVAACGRVVFPERTAKDGTLFEVSTPDFIVTMLEMSSGTLVRLTTNFYVGHHNKQTGIEFHGDLGSVYLQSWHSFDSAVEFAEFGGEYHDVPLLREPYPGTPWGRGVLELARALLEDRPHRFNGDHAAHITEILNAAAASLNTQRPVALTSTFIPPAPMEWAL